MKRVIVLTFLVFAVLPYVIASGVQQGGAIADYPSRQINVLIGFPPGGGLDTLAQLTQPFLEKSLGQGFVNEYMPGASGAIAWTRFAKQTPNDGYTIAIIGSPLFMTHYIMNSTITYNLSEITPLANIVTDPNVIVVRSNSPYQSVEELIDAARRNPGRITVGHSGVGSDDFFAIVLFERAFDVSFQLVPFQGDGPSWQAAMGGHIDASFNNLGITLPQVQAGNLRALALFAQERNASIPTVPTIRDFNHDVVIGSSRGWVAPRGIPVEAHERLLDAFRQMAADPAFERAVAERGLVPDIKIGDEYTSFLQRQETIFKQTWEEVRDQYRTN